MGELQIALETLCTRLVELDAPISLDLRRELDALGADLGVDVARLLGDPWAASPSERSDAPPDSPAVASGPTGHPVSLTGLTVTYLTPDDEVPIDVHPRNFDHVEDHTFRAHPRLRRALVSVTRAGDPISLWLHWSDGTDLVELDRIVSAGADPGDRFDGAVIVEAASFTCGSCMSGLRAMIVDGGLPPNTTERIRAHDYQQQCPVCGTHIAMFVVEHIE